jgi:uncharacterized membrane protein SpoIIM required for sporulation
MVVRTRSSGGRFVSLKAGQDTDTIDPIETIRLSKQWVYKIFLILTFFIMVSPWMFLVVKNNSLTVVTKKITDFYDNNFSCTAYKEQLENVEGIDLSEIKKKLF